MSELQGHDVLIGLQVIPLQRLERASEQGVTHSAFMDIFQGHLICISASDAGSVGH